MQLSLAKWILISQPVQHTTTMAENTNFIAEGQKKLSNIEIVNLLVNSKLGQVQKLLHCHLHLFSSQNYRHRAQIQIKNEQKFPNNYLIYQVKIRKIWCVPRNLSMSPWNSGRRTPVSPRNLDLGTTLSNFVVCVTSKASDQPAYTMQSDQSLCLSLEYSMTVKLLTEHHLEFLSLKGGCTGWSESTLVQMPHCWKSHVTAHMSFVWKDVVTPANWSS